jgi:hypothetical protein
MRSGTSDDTESIGQIFALFAIYSPIFANVPTG